MIKLILVCGMPGSGKTTLADGLSKKLKIACIHRDSIKEQLYESSGCSTLEDSTRTGQHAFDIMMRLAEEQLANDNNLIIESPFYFSKDYPLFKKLVQKYNLDLFSIICFVSTEERKKRFISRQRHPSHHDHVRVECHFAESSEYYYAHIPGKQIRVETNKPVEVLVKKVISQIN